MKEEKWDLNREREWMDEFEINLDFQARLVFGFVPRETKFKDWNRRWNFLKETQSMEDKRIWDQASSSEEEQRRL